MNRFIIPSVIAATVAIVPAAFAATPAKPQAETCSAAATVDANATEYIIAEYEGRLSPAERARWTSAQLADFEAQLVKNRPYAKIARALEKELFSVEVADATFDAVEDLSGTERQALVEKCHAAYVK